MKPFVELTLEKSLSNSNHDDCSEETPVSTPTEIEARQENEPCLINPSPNAPPTEKQAQTPKVSDPPIRTTTTQNERRSLRIRRKPARFINLLLPYLLMICMLSITKVDTLLTRDTVLFNEKPGLIFSESFWTVITDLDLSPAERAIQELEEKILGHTLVAKSYRNNEPPRLNYMAAEKIAGKIKLFEADLKYSKQRLTTFSKAFSMTSKVKRGAVDIGGEALKWLFGVATQKDLEKLSRELETLASQDKEITHILERQATLVNESLWEVHTTTLMVRDLDQKTKNLEVITEKLIKLIHNHQESVWEYFEYFTHLDWTFDIIATSLQWLHQLGDALDVGLVSLAARKLAPQIFPPAQMSKVLSAIKSQLPVGWTISSHEIWTIYQEATVSVASVNGKFRLFIQIPIYDRNQQFNLYEIINLPQAMDNATHGVTISQLPDFLAVSTDMEAFIELSSDDIQGCQKMERHLCNFHTGLNKKAATKSCAVSLFLNDKEKIETLCKKKFEDWKGPQVAYLGQNKWAFSEKGEHDVVFACPTGTKHLPPKKLRLPAVGTFEIPVGCTARTADWIFPASLDGQIQAYLDPLVPPSYVERNYNTSLHKPVKIVELEPSNLTSLNIISELLQKNEEAQLSQEMTGNQIKQLIEEQRKNKFQQQSNYNYPFEFVVTTILLAIGLGFTTYKIITLEKRLRNHENLELQMVTPFMDENGEPTE